MKRIISVVFSFIALFSIGQSKLHLSFEPYNGGQPLVFNTTIKTLQDEPYMMESFYYYISNIHILHDGGQDLDLSDTVIIIKNENYTFSFDAPNVSTVEQINFGVGVPQNKNHLDISKYPENHPLSYHTPSMHWGWNPGYFFVGIKGKGDQDLDGVPESNFELFTFADKNFRNVSLPIKATVGTNGDKDLKVITNLDQWIAGVDPGVTGEQHSNNGVNEDIMNNITSRPVFSAPANASINEYTKAEGNLTYKSTQGNLTVLWSELNTATSYVLIDMNGRTQQKGSIQSKKGEVNFSNLNSGSYIFMVLGDNSQPLNQLRVLN